MSAQLDAYYLDGRTALRKKVRVKFDPAALQIFTEEGETVLWPWDEVRQTRNFYGRDRIRLERGEHTLEALVLPAREFFEEVKIVKPKTAGNFHRPARGKKWIAIGALSALGGLGLLIPAYLWGIPALASALAPYIPVSWEERLGRAVEEQIAPMGKHCLDRERNREIQEILTTLTSSLPGSPYQFRAVVVQYPAVNAFAVPGGTIVICAGLLEKTSRPEELAGVLAHEIQHIQLRHSTRALLQRASLGLFMAALVGDGRAFTFGLEGAQAMALLRYSRRYEEEADEEGMKLLARSGIDPQGIITFFESLRKESDPSWKIPVYLSTHPDLGERVRRLKKSAEMIPRPNPRILQDYDWKEMQGFCKGIQPPQQNNCDSKKFLIY